MGNLGPIEIAFIAVVAAWLFGFDRIAQIRKGLTGRPGPGPVMLERRGFTRAEVALVAFAVTTTIACVVFLAWR
jgi:hypothetical protein